MSETTPHHRPSSSRWKDLLRLLRPHQWLKNLLVFVPAFTAHHFDDISARQCVLAFFSFSFCASAGYILNDFLDIENDRKHPTKCARPFASGRIASQMGFPLVAVMLAMALAVSTYMPTNFFIVLAAYFSLSLLYSMYFKRQMMLDIMLLALLYGLRLAGGSAATGVFLSPWLLSFATFMFVSLALIKRVSELTMQLSRGGTDPKGRGYRLADLTILESMAAASGYVAALTSGLYISNPAVTELYDHPERLWAIPAILLFWISRIIILTHRGEMPDDPVLFAAKDRTSLVCGALMVVAVIVSI